MSAVLKFPLVRKRWPDEITELERDEREEVLKYARDLAERYERRVAEVTAHARKLGEITLELQQQAETKKTDPALEQKFRKLADEWRKATKHLSSVDEMLLHPNYLKIIAMGQSAIPLLLRELKERPDHWLVALNVLTEQDPAQPEDTFYEAVQAWLAWGTREGHIS